MKKYIISIVFALGLGLNLSAQNDGFFSGNYTEYRDDVWAENMPVLPGQHGINYDFAADPAPLGSGLLVLAGLGLAYGMRRRGK